MSSTTEGSVVLQDFEVTIRVVTEEWNPLYADQSSQFYTNLSIAYYTFVSIKAMICLLRIFKKKLTLCINLLSNIRPIMDLSFVLFSILSFSIHTLLVFMLTVLRESLKGSDSGT